MLKIFRENGVTVGYVRRFGLIQYRVHASVRTESIQPTGQIYRRLRNVDLGLGSYYLPGGRRIEERRLLR